MGERRPPRVVQMTSAHRALDGRIFHKISRSLARCGYEVMLIGSHPKSETVDGVQIVALSKSPTRLRRMTLKLYEVYRKGLALDGDVYHFHDPELMLAGLLLRLRGKRVIYDAHEDLPRTVSYKDYVPAPMRGLLAGAVERFEIFAARRLTAIIGATPPIADRFRNVNPNTVVVHNFPILDEVSAPQPRCWEDRESAVAYIGCISRERGVFELLQAMANLNGTTRCRLDLAGWFSSSELKQQIQARLIPGRVEFLGMLSRDGITDFLSRVRVGIVALHPEPNFINSKPTKLFEYMSAGIPVIASDFPVWRQIVEDARCGLLIDPMKPAEIAQAIAYLLNHPEEAEEMGRRGRATVERLFSWKTEETTLMSLYSSILSQPDASFVPKTECA